MIKTCENHHSIDVDNTVQLGDCVIHCHACGNTITLDRVSAIFLEDKINAQGTWHMYYFLPNFNCPNCGALFTTYAVICQLQEESMLNYEMYKKVNNATTGRIQ